MQDLRRLAQSCRALVAQRTPDGVANALRQELAALFPGADWAVALYRGDPETPAILHTSGARGRTAAARRPSRPDTVENVDGAFLIETTAEGQPTALIALVPPPPPGTPLPSGTAGRLEILAAGVTAALAQAEWPAGPSQALPWDEALGAIDVGICLVEDGVITRSNRAFRVAVEADRPGAPRTGPWKTVLPTAWHATAASMLRPDYDGQPREVGQGERRRCLRPFALPGDVQVLLLEDQSERHRLEEQLVQSEKMSAIGQLIAGVAHDLNNPLASVVGFADYVMEDPSLPDQYREPLRVIQQEAERSANIVKNLLTFARKQERPWRPTRLPDLLTATRELMRNELASNRVELLLDIEGDLPPLNIEPNRMQQVIVNLVSNAAQALAGSGRQGRVLVRARRWSEGVAIEVSDNGPGIPPEVQDRIFEPFFTSKADGTGTGLGLSISQGIARDHGGHITLVGTSETGTVFRVELPDAAGRSVSDGDDGARAVEQSLRILVVDDEPHILHYMTATLESWGHTVVVAPDGAAAEGHLAGEPFDVIITDLRMPGVSGREFYERLRRDQPALADRVVFSTGDTVRGDTLAFLEGESQPCLHKPFSLVELRRALALIAASPVGHSDAPVPPR